jgi:hypothetical protein
MDKIRLTGHIGETRNVYVSLNIPDFAEAIILLGKAFARAVSIAGNTIQAK